MHSASSRFNSITLYAGLLMAAMCMVNFLHGRWMYNPQADVQFEITQLPSFIRTNNWDQASFRYNMHASTIFIIQICHLFTLGISSNFLSTLKYNSQIPPLR